MNTIFPTTSHITLSEREAQHSHRPLFVLFTGLSGAGKTTWANAIEKKVFQSGINTYLLDGDNLRSGLNKDLSFSPEDRRENLRRMAEVSKLFLDAGLVVFAAFIAPLEKDREYIKSIVGKDHYVEIYVNTPLSICEKRDIKGLYKRARTEEITQFTGISAPYEVPQKPDFIISYQDEIASRRTIENLNSIILKKMNPNLR